jgi:hypothetical protein
VQGTVNLSGTLEVDPNSFLVPFGTVFDIVNWSVGETGNFDFFKIDGQANFTFNGGADTFQEVFVGIPDGNGGYTGATPVGFS